MLKENDLNFTKKSFCELSLKTSLDELFLDKETYSLKLLLKYHLFNANLKDSEGLKKKIFPVLKLQNRTQHWNLFIKPKYGNLQNKQKFSFGRKRIQKWHFFIFY